MEDEFEDRLLYQTYISHMKLLSKYGWGLPLNTAFLSYIWRILKLCVARPETLILCAVFCIIFLYLQTLDVWSRSLYSKLLSSMDKSKKIVNLGKTYGGESWELKEGNVGVYSVQGRRLRMEDRFVVHEDINNTGISLYGIFDGHGGEFAANYAKDILTKNLNERLVEIKKYKDNLKNNNNYEQNKTFTKLEPSAQQFDKQQETLDKKVNFKKKTSSTDEFLNKSGSIISPDPYFQKILDGLSRPITREVRPTEKVKLQKIPLESYLDSSKFSGIDYGKIITDEILASDSLLLEIARKNKDVAGSTALIALIEGSQLIVANVGDSRGVMCNNKGSAIPLSFDHKPQQLKESKRIKEAGGFITFNGVWRVAGILATSRALGDYPLKQNKLVIADPDILTFDLSYHKPQFIILASDGLWDTFTNEEAVAFIKDHLDEPHFGAKSIALQAYYRGSYDNISVLVINLKGNQWSSFTMKPK